MHQDQGVLRSVRRGFLLLLASGMLLIGLAISAQATEPVVVTGPVTDLAGVAESDSSVISNAIESLASARDINLYVVFVDSFDGLTGAEWAEQTASDSGLTEHDAMLAIAVDENNFGFNVSQNISVNDRDRIARDFILPPLRESNWTQAALGAVDGLDQVAQTRAIHWAWIATGSVAVVGAGLVVWMLARAASRRRSNKTAVTPAETQPEAQPAAPVAVLLAHDSTQPKEQGPEEVVAEPEELEPVSEVEPTPDNNEQESPEPADEPEAAGKLELIGDAEETQADQSGPVGEDPVSEEPALESSAPVKESIELGGVENESAPFAREFTADQVDRLLVAAAVADYLPRVRRDGVSATLREARSERVHEAFRIRHQLMSETDLDSIQASRQLIASLTQVESNLTSEEQTESAAERSAQPQLTKEQSGAQESTPQPADKLPAEAGSTSDFEAALRLVSAQLSYLEAPSQSGESNGAEPAELSEFSVIAGLKAIAEDQAQIAQHRGYNDLPDQDESDVLAAKAAAESAIATAVESLAAIDEKHYLPVRYRAWIARSLRSLASDLSQRRLEEDPLNEQLLELADLAVTTTTIENDNLVEHALMMSALRWKSVALHESADCPIDPEKLNTDAECGSNLVNSELRITDGMLNSRRAAISAEAWMYQYEARRMFHQAKVDESDRSTAHQSTVMALELTHRSRATARADAEPWSADQAESLTAPERAANLAFIALAARAERPTPASTEIDPEHFGPGPQSPDRAESAPTEVPAPTDTTVESDSQTTPSTLKADESNDSASPGSDSQEL